MKLITKTILIAIILLVTFSKTGFCQVRIISGRVHTKSGIGISGATIQTSSSKKAAVTDSLGGFNISLSNTDRALLVSSVGYISRHFSLSSNPSFDLTLEDDPKALTEVVVTGYGIKKEAKRIGYSVQEVKGADLTKARDANPI